MVRTASQFRSMGSSKNPLTIESEEDSDGDQLDGTDEEYFGTESKRTAARRRQRRSAAGPSRIPAKRKKSLPEPESVDEAEAEVIDEPRSPEQYRQPSSSIIVNIKQNSTWKDAHDKVERVMQDRSLDRAAVRRARATYRRLVDEDVQWGTVDRAKGKDGDGRCRFCISKGKSCVVQLDESGSHGGPYHVISGCIHCLVSSGICDLLLQKSDSGEANPSIDPRLQTPLSTPSRKAVKPKFNSKHGPPSSPRTATPLLPHASVTKASKASARSTGAAGKSSKPIAPASKAKPDQLPIDQAGSNEPRPDKEEVVAAVRDMAEFVEQMRLMSSTGGVIKDIGTRGMFKLVEKQVEVLQRFAEQIE